MPESLKRGILDNMACAERYPDVEYQQLHLALAEHHQIPASWILAGNGETEAIFTLVQGLKPRQAMIVTPGFAEYRRALQSVECAVREFLLREADGWQLTGAILDALTPDLDCLFLCTPNNPTGLLPERRLLEMIAERCRSLGIALILDEAFIDFIPDEPGFIPLLGHNPHVWVLRSLTKFYAIPGLRLGYLVNGDARAVARMRERQMPWSINAFAALAGEMILQDRRLSAENLAVAGGRGTALLPSAAPYSRPDGLSRTGKLSVSALRRGGSGSATRDAATAHPDPQLRQLPGARRRYFRVAIRSQQENTRLLAAFRRVFNG